ncbi:MAG: T9SS type A sorting domain-containing protein, partial [Flavobacteriales bacterium]
GDIVIQCSTVSVGIVEPIQDVSFKMFPNPSSEFLTIEMNKMASVEVLNITGELIYQNATQNSDVTKLKVSDWGRGIYLVSATDEFGNRRTKRLEVY